VLCIVLSFIIFCDVCYSVLCVIVVPLPPSINPLAVIKNKNNNNNNNNNNRLPFTNTSHRCSLHVKYSFEIQHAKQLKPVRSFVCVCVKNITPVAEGR
jgi:hypothetical protein